jgi:hypothetical protein
VGGAGRHGRPVSGVTVSQVARWKLYPALGWVIPGSHRFPGQAAG